MISDQMWKILFISISLYYTITGIFLERLLNSIVINGNTQYIRNANSWLRIIWFSFFVTFTFFFVVKSIRCKTTYDEIKPNDKNYSKIKEKVKFVNTFNQIISTIFVFYILVTSVIYLSMVGSVEYKDIISSDSSSTIATLIILNGSLGLLICVIIAFIYIYIYTKGQTGQPRKPKQLTEQKLGQLTEQKLGQLG